MSSTEHHSPTVATVDLGALAHNLDQVRRRLDSTCQVIAVVKADAYGHGAVPVARTLESLAVSRFGVATLDEGIALREAGIRSSILLMGALFPEQFSGVVAHDLTPVLYEQALSEEFAKHLAGRSTPYPIHLKIETGMGRLGLEPEEVAALLQSPAFRGPLKAEGLMTHLADSDNADPAYTTTQLERFRAVIRYVQTEKLALPLIHTANSAAILGHPEARFTAVRPGIMLYGYHTATHLSPAPELRPVLSLTTRVVQVRKLKAGESTSYGRTYMVRRPSRIAVLPLGYADGYSRSLSNKGEVLINGKRASVVGRVCMDMSMVDVTDVPGVSAGTEVTVIGRQEDQQITAADLAAWQGTIAYEVLCKIGNRVTRIYKEQQ
ncbi:MAG TPA: alanine racemase [Nitrospiraceae bacterium]